MIRFFISSTFRDMQEERDAIHRTIFPTIRKYGLDKGVNVDICDLRWGIDFDDNWSEEEAIQEIMKVCFKEVKDCKPHIISMIGDFYGSKAKNPESIISLWKDFGRKESEIPENRDISLTQWELEFAFLSKKNIDTHSLCLFREKNEAENKDLEVLSLKERIIHKSNISNGMIRCDEYEGIIDFEQKLIEYAKEIIDGEAESVDRTNWVEEELKYSDAYSYIRSSGFAGRKKQLNIFKKFIENEDAFVLGFYGDSGIGKSSLMSKLYLQSKRNHCCRIITCGASQKSSRYLNVLLQLIYIIEKHLKDDDVKVRDNLYTEATAEKYLEGLLEQAKDSTGISGLVIFVDAMDKMSVGGTNRIVQSFLKTKPSNIKLVCTQIDSYNMTQSARGFITAFLEPLSHKEIEEIIDQKMHDSKQKRVKRDKNYIAEAILAKEGAASPLYVNTAINILKMHMAGGTNIESQNDYFVSLITKMPQTIEEICWYAIQEAISYVLGTGSNTDERTNCVHALGLIAVSRHGLKELDLERIFEQSGWRSVVFSSIRLFLADFFRQQEDGCWVFEHDIIKATVIDHVSKEFQIERGLERILYDYMIDPKCDDLEIKMREGLYLSFLFGNADLTANLFKLLEADGSMFYRTMAAKELYHILQLDKEYRWYKVVADAYLIELMKGLDCIIELKAGRVGEDYERRMPAKFAVEVLFDIIDLKRRYDIKRWCESSERTFDDKFTMASLSTEFVAAHDSVGDFIHTLEYEFYPAEFFQDDENIELFSEEQKRRAYRHLNTLFNINNNLLSNVNRLSSSIMEWHKRDTFGLNDKEKTVNGLFVGNRGQYYSAVGDLNKSISYRVTFLIERANNIFIDLGEQGNKFRRKYHKICGIESDFEQLTIKDFLKFKIEKHRAFWDEVEEYIISSITDEEAMRKLGYSWLRLGFGYRLISYDINKLSDDVSEYSRLVLMGCESASVAVSLFKSILIQNQRELFSAEVRRLQIFSKRLDLNQNEKNELIGWCISTSEDYIDNAKDYGEHVGELLLKAIKTIAANNIEDSIMGNRITGVIEDMVKSLSN